MPRQSSLEETHLAPYGDEVSPEEAHDRAVQQASIDRSWVALESRWIRQGQDSTWAPEFAAHVRALLDENGVPAETLQGLDCRQTLCRVALTRSARITAKLPTVAAQLETQLVLRRADTAGSSTPSRALDVFITRPGLARELETDDDWRGI